MTLTVPSPNAGAKTARVVGGMLAGADSIDDLDLLRHGGMGRLFSGVRAPSTLGTFLRSFTHGHVQQLDKVSAGLLAGLSGRVPGLLAGGGADGIAFLDVDDTVREVHGYAKQGAAFGYTGVRGLNLQLATISTATAAPVIARATAAQGQHRFGHRDAGRLLAQAITTARPPGSAGRILARADSAYYGYAFVGDRAPTPGLVQRDRPDDTDASSARSPASADDAWQAIEYPHAVFDEAEQRWVSDAEVAEVPFVAFTGRRKAEHVPCRLVVRRVKRLQPLASDGTEQGELFADLPPPRLHHQQHPGHRRGRSAPPRPRPGRAGHRRAQGRALAHLPSGKYAANAAWVACAVIAFNLARAAAVAADCAPPAGPPCATQDHQRPRPDRDHRADDSSCTCPRTGHGHGLGAAVVRRDRAHRPSSRPDHPAPRRARPEDLEVEEPATTGGLAAPNSQHPTRSTPITITKSTAVDQG